MAATVFGDAANPEILKRVGLDRARVLVIAIDDVEQSLQLAELARATFDTPAGHAFLRALAADTTKAPANATTA